MVCQRAYYWFDFHPTDQCIRKRALGPDGESRLKCTLKATRPNRSLFASAARAFAGVGRILLSLTAVLLVTAPLTQHVWTWDHFLQGGQDYESSTLMVLVFLSLVLVLAQNCKQSVSLLFAAWCQYSFLSRDPLLARIALVGPFSISHSECGASPGLEMYSLPLQI
jgi:hypothetical protein